MTKIGRKINILGTLVDQVPDYSGWKRKKQRLDSGMYWRHHQFGDETEVWTVEYLEKPSRGIYVHHYFESEMKEDDLMPFITDLYPDSKVPFKSLCYVDGCFTESGHVCFECGLEMCSRHGYANRECNYMICKSCYVEMDELKEVNDKEESLDKKYFLCILDSKDKKAVSVIYEDSEQSAGKKFMKEQRIISDQLKNEEAFMFVHQFGEHPLNGGYNFTFTDDLRWSIDSDDPKDELMTHVSKCPIGWMGDYKLRTPRGFDEKDFIQWKLKLDEMVKRLWYMK